MTIHIPTDEELQQITDSLHDFEPLNVTAMSHIRKVLGLSQCDIVDRFSHVNSELIRRYMRPSYERERPIHFMAAFSWVTNVPATSFYLGSKIMESWRGMDDDAVNSLVYIGGMPFGQFDMLINCIFQYLTDDGKKSVEAFKLRFLNDNGVIDDRVENALKPPEVINLETFGKSYYESIAIAVKRFRESNGLSVSQMAKALGISDYKYREMENVERPLVFSLTVGARIRLAFRLNSHSLFTKEMVEYSEFHHFRVVQEYKESILIESIKCVKKEFRPYVVEIIKGVAQAYVKNKPQ